MIPYVEILQFNADKTAINPFAVIEPSECWFEISYYEIGEFEIYAAATEKSIAALQKGNFVKIPHKSFLWVITAIQYEYNADGARMVSAKGFEAKWIVSKRIIRDPLELPVSLGNALERLFSANLGANAITQRRIKSLVWAWNGLQGKTTEAQATRGNLLEFTLNLLKLHKVGTISTLQNGKILFSTVNGTDRSDSVLFSQSLDNLISATYFTNDEELKTNAQIVSTFSDQETVGGVKRTINHDYVAYYPAEAQGASDIDRAELLVQSNLSTKITNESGQEIEISPDSAQYIAMQEAEGAGALAEKHTIVEFNGEIDLVNCQYVFGENFGLGDLVKIRDEYFGFEAKARILKYTIKQDADGYGEEAEFGE